MLDRERAQKEGRWIARGDPMEAALDVLARRLGIDVEADEASVPVTKRFRSILVGAGCLWW